MNYNHKEIEKNGKNIGLRKMRFNTHDQPDKPKFYALDMFPYPSGQRIARRASRRIYSDGYSKAASKRSKDSTFFIPWVGMLFGLPAEQYALDTGNDPAEFTKKY